MSDKLTVGFVALGCAKNQINTEIMIADVQAHGYEITGDVEKSDITVINTCGFINDAREEALEVIFETVQLKKEGKIKKIIVCGCMAQKHKTEIADELFEIDGFVGTGSFGRIVEAIDKVMAGERVVMFDGTENLPLEGERFVITPYFSTYLKIADGCSNRCAYCSIPEIRGDFRSRPMESILDEAKLLCDKGAKELIVIAQDTSNYGIDIYGQRKLPELLRRLCAECSAEWIRVMYLYPDKITDEIIEVIKTEPKIVKYIEMPIQHASANVLKRMNRPGDDCSLLALIKKLKAEIPGVVLRTTVMVGFPGETDEDFEILCGFLKKAEFDRLGVFKYSPEENTPACDMDGQIPDSIKDMRAEAVEMLQSEIVLKKQEALIGKELTVISEGYDRFAECYFGRSYMEAPDIDGKIFFTSDDVVCSGDTVKVRITDTMDFEMIGEIVK